MSTEKVLQLKNVHSSKNGSEVLKPYIQNFVQNSTYVFYKMPTLWSLDVNKPF